MTDESKPITTTEGFEIPPQDRLYTAKDCMYFLGIKPTKFRIMVMQGWFAPSIDINVGGKNKLRRWLKSDIDKWLQEKNKI